MDPMIGATNNYEPSSDLIQEVECDTLLLYLPGFTKEQLRVQLSNTGELKISGLRLIGDNKWSSFQKNFPISANCDTNKITAKFEGGILYVRQPKLIVPAEKEVKKIISPETVRPPTPIPKTDQQSHNVYAGLPIARLKMSGRMITMGLTVLFAFLLGMYVRNLSWFSKNQL